MGSQTLTVSTPGGVELDQNDVFVVDDGVKVLRVEDKDTFLDLDLGRDIQGTSQ